MINTKITFFICHMAIFMMSDSSNNWSLKYFFIASGIFPRADSNSPKYVYITLYQVFSGSKSVRRRDTKN